MWQINQENLCSTVNCPLSGMNKEWGLPVSQETLLLTQYKEKCSNTSGAWENYCMMGKHMYIANLFLNNA
jgi:hypothetical protein